MRLRYFLIVILVIITGGYILLHSRIVSSVITAKIENTLKTKYNIALTIESLSPSIIPPGADINTITGSIPATGRFNADKISVRIGLWNLILGKLYIKKIFIDSPVLKIKIPEIPGKNADKKIHLPAVIVKRLSIKDGNIAVEMPGIQSTLTIAKLDLDLGMNLIKMRANSGIVLEKAVFKNNDKIYKISTLRANIEYDNKALSISSLDIISGDTRLYVKGSVGKLERKSSPELNLDINLITNAENLHSYASFIPEMGGEISLSAKTTGTFPNIKYSGSLKFTKAKVLSMFFEDIETDFSGNYTGLNFSNTTIKTSGGKILAEGKIDFTKAATFSCSAALNNTSFAELLEGFTVTNSHVDSKVNGNVNISGSLYPVNLKGNADLVFTDFRVMEKSFRIQGSPTIFRIKTDTAVKTSVEIDMEKVKLFDAVVRGGTSVIYADAILAFNNFMQIKYNTESLDLGLVFPMGEFNLSGLAAIKGTIEGPYNNPHVSGVVAARDTKMIFLNLWEMDVRVDYYDKIMNFSNIQIYKDDLLLEGDGSIDFSKTIELTMNIDVAYADLATLILMLGISEDMSKNFSGSTSGTVKLSGIATNLDGEIILDMETPTVYGINFNRGSTTVKLGDQGVIIDKLMLSGNSGEIKINGAGNYVEKWMRGEMTVGNLQLPEFHREIPLAGILNGEISISVDNNGYAGNAKIRLSKTSFSSENLADTEVTAKFHEYNLELNGNLFGNSAEINSILSLTPPYNYRLMTQFYNLPLSGLAKHYLSISNPIGNLRGNLKAEGKLANLEDSIAQLSIEKLKIGNQNIFITNKNVIAIEFEHGDIDIPEFFITGDNVSFSIKGHRTATGINSFLGKGIISLKVVDALADFITYGDGNANMFISISGTDTNPLIGGFVSINGGTLAFKGFPRAIEEIDTDITLIARNIFIDGFSAKCGGGDLGIYGGLILNNFAPKSINLEGKLFNVKLPSLLIGTEEELPGTVSGNIQFSGPLLSPTLRGDLTVNQAIYQKNLDWQEKLLKIRTTKYIAKGVTSNAFRLGLDLAVDIPDSITVKNNMADITLGGNITIKGVVPDIYLLGEIDLRKGYIFFQANSFKITTGLISFKNPADINPYFDISSVTEKEDEVGQKYRITLNINGTLDNLKAAFMSDPSISDKDIVSLLRYGVKSEKLEIAGATSSEMYSLGGTVLISELMKKEKVKEILELGIIDKVAIHPYTSDRGRTTTLLTVGKSFGDRVKLEYSTDVGSSTQYMWATSEYSFGRYMSVISSWNNEVLNPSENKVGNLGVDLSLHYEF
ncbi:MAG TPA: translocation/assembly module TamB domain-containing protein [bacterium]